MKRDRHLSAFAGIAAKAYSGDVARLLDAAPVDDATAFLANQPVSNVANIMAQLPSQTAAQILSTLPAAAAKGTLTDLGASRAARLIARLDPDARKRCVELLPPETGRELQEILAYPPDRAGALMDPQVAAFRADVTVREVVRRLRGRGRKRIHDLFVIDEEGQLTGTVSLQAATLADPSQSLRELLNRNPPFVRDTDLREQVIHVLETSNASSLGVVDINGKLLGVLRHEELLEATEHEATADMLTMVGASKEERALSSPLFAVRKRLPWLHVNLLTAFLAAAVVGLFEDTIARVTALAVLLPVVAGQSGNTGAQAMAVTMRGLALREIRLRHWLRVSGKESLVGALNGLAVATTTGAAVWLWSRSLSLAGVVAVSMVISMVAAALAGALIPMALTATKQDPAQSSSIILTTVTDVVGFLSFLGIATLFASSIANT